MQADQAVQIELVPVRTGVRLSDEDWYIHANGISRGYIYRVANGYAVGIEENGEVAHTSIELDKDAAIAFARKHLCIPGDTDIGKI